MNVDWWVWTCSKSLQQVGALSHGDLLSYSRGWRTEAMAWIGGCRIDFISLNPSLKHFNDLLSLTALKKAGSEAGSVSAASCKILWKTFWWSEGVNLHQSFSHPSFPDGFNCRSQTKQPKAYRYILLFEYHVLEFLLLKQEYEKLTFPGIPEHLLGLG